MITTNKQTKTRQYMLFFFFFKLARMEALVMRQLLEPGSTVKDRVLPTADWLPDLRPRDLHGVVKRKSHHMPMRPPAL